MENNFFWKKCLTEKRTEGHNSIVSEVPFFFKSLVIYANAFKQKSLTFIQTQYS